MITDKNNLNQLIESILFVAGQGVEISDIADKLEINKRDVINAIEELKKKHKDDGINIITYKNSAQMCSNPNFADDIASVLNPIREKQLTKAALETMAIIAYKQPVTRLDIEQIRGVSSDYALQVLTNFNLIEIVGRKDVVGKPILFGTTDEFLKRFGLQSIEDLPDYDELLERIKVIHSDDRVSDALYGSTEIIPEEQLQDGKNISPAENVEVKASNLEQYNKVDLQKNQTFTEEEVRNKLTQSYSSDDDSIIDNFKDDVL